MNNYYCHGELSKAKILVIGHDKTLQKADTISDNPFFADLFFRDLKTMSIKPSDKRKFGLAEAVYYQIRWLTCDLFNDDEVILTNLSWEVLPHAPVKKTVYIPREVAKLGIERIQEILSKSSVQFIFAMSEQVNYWLQELNFYPQHAEFIKRAIPHKSGVDNKPPYYRATRSSFPLICAKWFERHDDRIVVPIHHVKQWPLYNNKNRARKYGESYLAHQLKFKNLNNTSRDNFDASR